MQEAWSLPPPRSEWMDWPEWQWSPRLRPAMRLARSRPTIAPAAPITAASASLRVDKINATAVRLQGSMRRGAWGITAGVGVNGGIYTLDRRVRLLYPDSLSEVEEESRTSWDNGVSNVGLTRRVQQADVIVQHGEASAPSDASMLRRDSGSRRSLSLGVQFVY